MTNVSVNALLIKEGQKRIRETRNGGIAMQEHPGYVEKKESLITSVKDKIKTLLFGDELDIAQMFGKKEEGNLISDKQFKKMRLQNELNEIKNNPNFEIFKNLITQIKDFYDKTDNLKYIDYYINRSILDENEKEICLYFSNKIIDEIVEKNLNFVSEPGMNNSNLRKRKICDAFFALGERDFNL